MSAVQLLTEHLALWTSADTEKKSGRGRASGNTASVYGIKKLRELILELAVRGKLVPQDSNDEPASELLERIYAEKAKLIADGKIKQSKPLAPIQNDEKPFELPTGWTWTRLGDITNFGVTEKPNLISNETWVLDLEDIEKDTSKLLQKIKFGERNSLSDKNKFFTGDILYGKLRPYLNKVIVADESGVCTTEILPIRCYGFFDSHYFMYTLKSPYYLSYVNAKSYGMKMPRLGTEDGRKSCFPLPPLAEQHRIVAKVDELMLLCDQLENQHTDASVAHEKLVSYLLDTLTQSKDAADFNESWQRIAANFEVLFTTESSIDELKQTLLQLAVMGKLVPQDAHDEPAGELLKRIQNEKEKLIAEGKIKKSKPLAEITDDEKPFELPKGWRWVRLEDLLPSFQNGASSRGDADGKPIVVLRLADIKSRRISYDDLRELLISQDIIEKYCLNEGDILIVRVNGSADLVGGFIVCEQDFNGIYCDHFIRMRLSKNIVNPSFMALLGSSHLIRNKIKDLFVTTAGQKTVNQGHISSLVLPLLSLSEQQRIVEKVEEIMTICDTLKSRISAASLLQQKISDVLINNVLTKSTNYQAGKNNIIEFQINQNDDYKLLVLAAEITFQLQNESTYGHLKLQKLIYLCQQIRNMTLPTNFFRAAAGPYDKEMAHYIDGEFLKRGWFDYDKERKPKYRQLESCGGHQADFNKYFGSEAKHIYHLIGLFRTNLSENIEIVATLFACWKDVINSKESVTDALLLERFYAWSDEKRKFQNNQVLDCQSALKNDQQTACKFDQLFC